MFLTMAIKKNSYIKKMYLIPASLNVCIMLVFVVPYFIYIVLFLNNNILNYFNHIHIKMIILYFTSLLHILHILTM